MGVCLGCIAGVSAAFLASRGLAELPDRADLTEIAYYAVFFASILWVFAKPVAVGARDLLYLSALLTILIPVFDLLLVGQSIWRNAFTEHWPLLIVDLLALMGALAFWKMGRRVSIRAETGDPNSVWADVVIENQEKKNRKNLAGSVFEKVS